MGTWKNSGQHRLPSPCQSPRAARSFLLQGGPPAAGGCSVTSGRSLPLLLTHLHRSQAAPRPDTAALANINNSEFILYKAWSWFVSRGELTQRSRSAKHPPARHCSFDFRDAPRPALHRVPMRVKWDGAIREARRKGTRAEMRAVKPVTSQRGPDLGHRHQREGG